MSCTQGLGLGGQDLRFMVRKVTKCKIGKVAVKRVTEQEKEEVG